MIKSREKKVKFTLIGVILILVVIIIFILLISKASQTEIDGLKLEILERNETIRDLEFKNNELNIVDDILKKDNSKLRDQKDSILKISYEIYNPKTDPVPGYNARNDSIRKWSKRFQ